MMPLASGALQIVDHSCQTLCTVFIEAETLYLSIEVIQLYATVIQ